MSWRNIRLIWAREVRDQLRDRRTLFMIAVLPLLLYPAMGIGMVQMTLLFTEQPRTVVVLGADHLPRHPTLLRGNRIDARWFNVPEDSDKLEVISDADGKPADSELLEQSRQIERLLGKRRELEAAQSEAAKQSTGGDASTRRQAKVADPPETLESVQKELSALFAESHMQVLIVVPEDFGANIEKMNRQIAERSRSKPLSDYPRPVIVQNSADEKSQIAYHRVKAAIEAWEADILKQRLDILDLPQTLPKPVRPDPVDLAAEEELSASFWSKLFPALLVVMAVTGAFYPAVDLAAGEKERGTMETLLISPAKRSELVVGKFLTVMLFSLSTALLNLVSLGLTSKYLTSITGGGAFAKMGDLSLPSPVVLLWVVVLLIPLAALFSALCLSLATFARSSKEGQYYQTPLLMITMGLTVFCLSPAVEINLLYSVMPVVGIALLLKALLASAGSVEPLIYAVPVLVTSFGYSLLALWWAIDQFSREEVLFREAERFELRLWLRHVLRDKEPTPNFTEAACCFVIIMLLQFGAMKFMQSAITDSGGTPFGTLMMKLLIVQQLAIIAAPAVLMGILLTTSVPRTFRLRLPNWRILAVAALLPLTLHPLTLELARSMQEWFFPPLPKSFQNVALTMKDSSQNIWFVLMAFAMMPAVCEELAFRGFILSGFARSGRTWLAIGLSSLTFGLMHMIPQQVFNAALLGVVLGLIAVRGNSLIPCVVFHFAYNGLQVVRERTDASVFDEYGLRWLFAVDNGELHYRWPLLIVCAAVSILLLRWLVTTGNRSTPPSVAHMTESHPRRLAEAKLAENPPVHIP